MRDLPTKDISNDSVNKDPSPNNQPDVEDGEVEKLKAQAAEHLAGWQRAMADYANLDKSWQEKQRQFLEMAKAASALEILPIIDHFQLAISHIPPEDQTKPWVQGIKHIMRELEQLVDKFGVKEIAATTRFDPVTHEAVSQEPNEQPAGTIVKQVRVGYQMNGKVIQPAQVIVSSGKPVTNPPPADTESDQDDLNPQT